MPILAAPIPTGVICWAGSVGGLSLEIGSVLEFALVLTGGMTGIVTGVGIGYKALGTEIFGVGLLVGTSTGTGDGTGGDTAGAIATGDGDGVTLGLGVGTTIAVGWFLQAVTIAIADKHMLR